jgi:hypothetical protein
MKNILAWSISFNFIQFCLICALWESRKEWIASWRTGMRNKLFKTGSEPVEK